MQSITLQKVPGESYKANSFKVYRVTRGGAFVGTLEQAPKGWEVLSPTLAIISVHTTIKAAVRVAGRVL